MIDNVMFDLETLGTDTDCVILSMGAVFFDPKQDKIGKGMHGYIKTGIKDIFSGEIPAVAPEQPGRSITKDTIEWWRKQDPIAKRKIQDGQEKANTLQFTLMRLFSELKKIEDPVVWGNGASFDISILEHCFKQYDIPIPWKFWNVRCFRTLKNLCPAPIPFEGVRHDALDDALHQTKYLRAAYKKYKLV